MRYKPEQKEETRKKIIEAAERSFKSCGYSGLGVDALAKEAGVTSGAFYGHFKSKEDAFKHAISAGLNELDNAIKGLKEEHGDTWWQAFSAFYTTQKRTCNLTESCALQSLTPEVGRSNRAVRHIFSEELLKVIETASSDNDENKTWAMLAMLVGGVTLARAVESEELSDKISSIINHEVATLFKQE